MKSSSTLYILIGIIVILGLGVIGLLLYINNQADPLRGVTPLVEIAPMEADSEKWSVNYPNQYSTLVKTETNNERTAYGGSEPYSKLETDPRLVTLFAGYGFSKEYNEDRGHMNSLSDVEGTARVGEKTPGTCYSCKSSDNPRLWDEMGMAEYDATPFMKLGNDIDHAIFN